MRARVPGSSANLGPGFDTLGLALTLYTEVTVEPASSLSLTVAGEGADLPADEDHLAVRVVRSVLGHDRVAIRVWSEIPVSRGLGSSAALALAAAAAAGSFDPVHLVSRLEGHADNAAASMMGGLVTASLIDGGLVSAASLALDPALSFVAIIPDRHLSTEQARALLPTTVPIADAVFNLGRMGALIAGLADHRCLLATAGLDRLHQQQRSPLFPESSSLLGAMIDGGALVSFWSGAGPTLLGVCERGDSPAVVERAQAQMARMRVAGRVVPLEADRRGLVLTET